MSHNPEDENGSTPDPADQIGPDPGERGDSLFRRVVDRVAMVQHPALLFRLIIAVALVAVLTYLDTAFLGWSLAVGAAIALIPLARVTQYAAAFLPYAALWLVFSLFRSMANETGIPLRTAAVTSIERAMFFGHTPTIWLQVRFYDPLNLAWYDYATTFIHWSYFFVPHLVAVLVYRHSPQLYRRFLATMLIVLSIGLAIYFLTPAAPPWLTADRAPQEDIYRVMAKVGSELHSGLYERTYSALGDPNPVAAMPSMHQAATVAACIFALHSRRNWLRWLAVIYCVLMAYTLVYTGEHYVIDVLIGTGIAIYGYAYSGRWLNAIGPLYHSAFRRHRRASALADTQPSPQPVSPVPARLE